MVLRACFIIAIVRFKSLILLTFGPTVVVVPALLIFFEVRRSYQTADTEEDNKLEMETLHIFLFLYGIFPIFAYIELIKLLFIFYQIEI